MRMWPWTRQRNSITQTLFVLQTSAIEEGVLIPDMGKPIIRLATTGGVGIPWRQWRRNSKSWPGGSTCLDLFEKGQIVAWKPGLKNRMFPEDGEPAIVTSVLPTPVFDLTETSAASPYFQEALSLVIGVFRDDDLLEFRVDGRRFMPITD